MQTTSHAGTAQRGARSSNGLDGLDVALLALAFALSVVHLQSYVSAQTLAVAAGLPAEAAPAWRPLLFAAIHVAGYLMMIVLRRIDPHETPWRCAGAGLLMLTSFGIGPVFGVWSTTGAPGWPADIALPPWWVAVLVIIAVVVGARSSDATARGSR